MEKVAKGLALAFFVALCGSAASAEPTPRDVVLELYRLELGPHGDFTVGPLHDLHDPLVLRHFTRDLRRRVEAVLAEQAKTGEAVLDFDPITDGNGGAALGVRVEAAPPDRGATKAVATFHTPQGEVKTVTFRFLREGGAWKVDDIADPSWDLRKLIADGLAGK